jgi:hypothetical protein
MAQAGPSGALFATANAQPAADASTIEHDNPNNVMLTPL